jgi:hypothetical protein
MTLVGLLASTVRSYGWLTIAGAVLAWGTAGILARFGDRGAAIGVAASAGLGLAVGCLVVIAHWAASGWPLW